MRCPRPVIILALLALAGCAQQPVAPETTPAAAAVSETTTNPFFEPSPLPFQAPPFDRIKDGDYQPAIEEGMRRQRAEWTAIANDPAAPDFQNTFVALEKSGALLHRVMAVFNAITAANTNPALQELAEKEAPRLAAHEDAKYLDPRLFARVRTVYDARNSLPLDPESRRLVEVVHQQFVLRGAMLPDAGKARLRELNQRQSTLEAQFNTRLLAAANAAAPVIADRERLAGLPDDALAAAAQTATERGAQGKWVLALQNTTQQPDLEFLQHRDTRKVLFDASWNRAEMNDANDTRAIIAEIAQIRAAQAQLLGFDNFAAWTLQDQMAKTPATVMDFLGKLAPPATARARQEAADIQAEIDRDRKAGNATPFALEAWDWLYYAARVRQARYDLDAAELRPYFELDRVLEDGVFYAANLLYGITFKERHDIPVYQPDVRVFDVFDKDGQPLALFYTDYFKRDNKNGGAWMDNFVQQSRLLGTRPVIYNVANITKPAPGQPALISFDDVITLFHEFGHALHGIFADQEYPSLSGTNTARDFVEFPSQFNEHWATDTKVFAHYARHYRTGAPMPDALVAKMRRSALFNKGYDMTELVSAALLDMNWHTLPASAPRQDVDRFEAAALARDKVDLAYVPPRYRSSYFLHIWSNGYAAGYYAYLWTQMLADDAFRDFQEHGGLTAENGRRFRDMILSRGNSEDLATLYRTWRGQPPSIEPMLIDRGLKEAPTAKPSATR
ncbi:peptidyl-dipeptidase Dcp [Dokdonella sp.]|uniref:peptidyl-dipeptidase Dcp n=1 Tax=Dokdonella sp. TaxID=2291710 RepID=UPI0031C5D6FB|nr:peptidyl-dipeptidase Dcp [Dokdonella sp.]